MNVTDKFIENLNQILMRELPSKVIERTKISLLDYLCVTSAGAYAQKGRLDTYVEYASPEQGDIPVIGMGCRLNLKEAVFLNGLNSHALDFDDGTNAGIIHLGSPIYSVLLPLAQKRELTMDKMLRAAILGYETSFTMAVSIQPIHKERGFHATGTCGILGIAMAVSELLGFTALERKNAFAAACVSATGMLNVLDDGSELKPYNVAKTALLGLIATQMAKAGYQANPDPLGGERGYLKMMAGTEKIKMKKPLLNGTYAIEKAYIKPYAACRYCHPAIEAAIRVRSSHQIADEKIRKIRIRTYYWAVNKHDHTKIISSASAKMSIPYGVAVGMIYGKAGLQEYSEEYIRDLRIQGLTKKVEVIADNELTELFPTLTIAIMEITMENGEVYEERVDYPKGEPENPMDLSEFREKYEQLYLFSGKSQQQIDNIFHMVMDGNTTVRELLECL